MAVLPMKKITICAMKRERKAILEKLQALGMVEIETGSQETDDFKKMNTNAPSTRNVRRTQMGHWRYSTGMFQRRRPCFPVSKEDGK